MGRQPEQLGGESMIEWQEIGSRGGIQSISITSYINIEMGQAAVIGKNNSAKVIGQAGDPLMCLSGAPQSTEEAAWHFAAPSHKIMTRRKMILNM